MTAANSRRSVSGGAKKSSLSQAISDSATTLNVIDASTWPSGSVGPAAMMINRGQPNEEKIFYTTRTGNVLNNCERGADGSLAFAHAVGESVEHIHTALDTEEANRHIYDTTRNDHTQYLKKDIAQTVSGVVTFQGNNSHTGTETFSGDVHVTGDTQANTLSATTVYGNPNFSGHPTVANVTVTDSTFANSPVMPMATAVSTLDGTAVVGTSLKPARQDHKHDLDKKAELRRTRHAGEILEWAGTQLPGGADTNDYRYGEYAWADGSTIVRATFPEYMANVGTAHGSGNGTTTVNLPDRRGRVGVGVDGAHSLGAKAGNLTKSLSSGENGPHNHTINDPTHTHGVDSNADTGARIGISHSSSYGFTSSGVAQSMTLTGLVASATGISINSSGSGTAFSIEQPWIGLNYIVKVH